MVSDTDTLVKQVVVHINMSTALMVSDRDISETSGCSYKHVNDTNG